MDSENETAVLEEAVTGEFMLDGTVDLNGNPVHWSRTVIFFFVCKNLCASVTLLVINSTSLYGKQVDVKNEKLSRVLIVYEVFERVAFFGVSTNLVVYLTKKLHQGTVASANNVTNWSGVALMAPLLGAYFADEHFGRYWCFSISSAINIVGMCLLTLSVSIPRLKPYPCRKALESLALGSGGTKSNISSFGAQRFDEFEPKEKKHKLSFNWWVFCVFIGNLLANTFLVYIQDNVSWALGYGIPTMGLAISTLIFLVGTPHYRHKVPIGNHFTAMVRVIVASLRKWGVSLPDDLQELYEIDVEYKCEKGKNRMKSTPSLRFLDKAAVRVGEDTRWMLCSVTQVEETKQVLRMIPILAAIFVPSTMVAQANTLFVKQGTILDKHIGSFEIPPASLHVFLTILILISIAIYDCFFVKVMKKWTRNPRGITLLQRMGVGLVLHVVVMVIASITESKRLRFTKHHGVVENGEVPLTIFVLVPQFILMGMADAVLEGGKMEFFYDQAPESMKSWGASLFPISLGMGSFLSSIILSTVSNITKKHCREGWILDNLNASHLDYYYAFLAMLSFLNLMFFIVVARIYVYKVQIPDMI
ncbi:hypothetical protein Sjap_006095 [Stephania japonica]|uniref:Uncharacterized protein n=1 Tax=Stephania japonica TaxID=461633 RepID=A0AAP0K7N7_9MAGN